MKVGILGSGDVARRLAGGFISHHHDVMLGSRTPAKLADWAATNPRAATGTFSDAAQFGELIVLAVKGTGRRTESCG
jgi:predicted dinucleotide-binding enzyme